MRPGRTKPYTIQGIRRVPCVRCGKPSYSAMAVCADDSVFRPICRQCDITFNRMVLKFMCDPDAKTKMDVYCQV